MSARREHHEACQDLVSTVETLSDAVDALVEVARIKRIEFARLSEHADLMENTVAEQEADLHMVGRRIDDLLDQLRLKDEQLEQLRRDYDKDMDLLRETIARQAAVIEKRASE